MVTCVPTGPLVGVKLKSCGSTRNETLLVNVPVGVVTVTEPVVPPTGMVAVSNVSDLIVNGIEVPLSETFVVPVKPWPRMPNICPALVGLRTKATNGLSPTPKLKTVPQLSPAGQGFAPPREVEP